MLNRMRLWNIFQYTSLIILLFVLAPKIAQAELYRIYLEYNQAYERLDLRTSTTEKGYEVIDDLALYPNDPDTSPFSVHIYEQEIEIVNYMYNPERSGALTLDIPFQPTADRIVFRKAGVDIFQIDVSDSIACVENGMCEVALGESLLNCIADCGGDKITYDQEGVTQVLQNARLTDDSGRVLYQTPDSSSTEVVPISSTTTSSRWPAVLGGVMVVIGVIFLVLRIIRVVRG
jgi:hypothetical protein